MKKTVILLSLAASFFMFAGCASKGTPETGSTTVKQTTETVVHEDYKGEVGVSK